MEADAGPWGWQTVVRAYAESPVEGMEALVVEPQPAPNPADLEPDDAVVAVRSASIGWVDLLMLSGQYQHMVQLPYTPGLEYSGVVTWTGENVDPAVLAPGDAVMADPFSTGPRSDGARQRYGGLASYAVARAGALIRMPAGMSFDQGACFLGGYETAYHALVARGGLQAGQTVLVHGATGSTGLAAVQVARAIGARVIATGRSKAKLSQVTGLGADHVVCLTNPDEPEALRSIRDDVRNLTGGEGVDVVYDPVGGELTVQSLRCVRFGAKVLIVGWASTPFVARGKGGRGAPRANLLPTNLIMMKSLDVLGCPTVITTHRDPSIREERLGCILGWWEEGTISPAIGATFQLRCVREAMRAKWESRMVGNCVVHCGDAADPTGCWAGR